MAKRPLVLPVIAMTREMGSLGKDVAAGVARRSGRRVVYHEILEPVADKMRLRKSHVEHYLDGTAGLWQRFTTDKTSLSIFTAEETFRLLADGATGVVRGWGAAHLLKDVAHVVKVRVCAPFEVRVDRMMRRLGSGDRAAVAASVALSDEAHTAITRRHFGIDWRDPEHYDLVLSTERLAVDECIEQICAVMGRPRFQPTPASEAVVANLALEASVRAALHRYVRAAQASIRVRADSGTVWLSGAASSRSEGLSAGEIAARVPGVCRVENELGAAGAASLREWQAS